MQLHKILIHRVFPALRKKNIIARGNFWCCQTCGHAAAARQARKNKNRGWVFWHGQDEEEYKNLLKPKKQRKRRKYNPFKFPPTFPPEDSYWPPPRRGRRPHPYLRLCFGHITRLIDRNIRKVGQEAADECRRAGLRVKWNGSSETGIEVRLRPLARR